MTGASASSAASVGGQTGSRPCVARGAERTQREGDLLGGAADGKAETLRARERGGLDDDPGRPPYRGRIATDLDAGRLEGCKPGSELDEVAPLLDVPAPDVGVSGRELQHLGAPGADHDRDPAGSGAARSLFEIAGGVEGALEVGATLSQQRQDDLGRLLEPAEHMVLGQPERVCLATGVPGPEPNTNRPPLISSIVSTAFAVIPGFRWSAEKTHVPTLTRDVAAAMAPVMATPSHHPCGRRPRRHNNSSGAQTIEPHRLARPSAVEFHGSRPAAVSAVGPGLLHREDETRSLAVERIGPPEARESRVPHSCGAPCCSPAQTDALRAGHSRLIGASIRESRPSSEGYRRPMADGSEAGFHPRGRSPGFGTVRCPIKGPGGTQPTTIVEGLPQ